jgi:glycosyltransferase involved in cell wall biosynthesis
VLVNSALAADAIGDLPAGVPVVVYVHEEGTALASLPAEGIMGLKDDRVQRVLCVSEASRGRLIEMGVADELIRVLQPLVARAAVADEVIRGVREDLGVGSHQRLVVGCGEASWRKGADLFTDTVRRLREHEDLRFAWIGRRPRGFARRLDHDLARTGLSDAVVWTGELDQPDTHLAAADVLVMTSREDPQPLVPLEAAHLGTPTVAFDVGGLAELGAAGAALTVPFPDTTALAASIVKLLDDRSLEASLVEAARRRAAAQGEHVLVPRFVEEVRSVLERAAVDEGRAG